VGSPLHPCHSLEQFFDSFVYSTGQQQGPHRGAIETARYFFFLTYGQINFGFLELPF
jgi:hypothetical protein